MASYGIDTSIFVRLLTGDPEKEYLRTKQTLEQILTSDPSAEIVVSNLVIAEAYFVVQHHYKVSKIEARKGISSVLTSGLVKPLKVKSILDMLSIQNEPGLVDRLMADDYETTGCLTLGSVHELK